MLKVSNFSQEQIKEINRVRIIKMLRKCQTTTKQEIAQALSLSIPTVTTNINMLLHEGLIIEDGVADSTGGRKPVVLRFVNNARYSFGVNIKVNEVEIILVNLEGEKEIEVSFKYSDSYSFIEVLEQLKNKIEEIIQSQQIDKEKIVGVGIALPGLVDDDGLILESAPNILVENFSFKEFGEVLGIKIYIENEANAAAFAEMKLGKARSKDNIVYVSVNEGIGTGIIIHNHIYKGNGKRAGEFGHISISSEPRKCNCGRTGCWELYASSNSLLRYYEEAVGKKADNIQTVFDAYSSDYDNVKLVFEKYGQFLLKGIENIILGLNPDYVIIGGEIGKYEKQLLKNLKKITNHHDYIEFEGTRVLFSALNDKGALIGAALLPLEEIYNYRKSVI